MSERKPSRFWILKPPFAGCRRGRRRSQGPFSTTVAGTPFHHVPSRDAGGPAALPGPALPFTALHRKMQAGRLRSRWRRDAARCRRDVAMGTPGRWPSSASCNFVPSTVHNHPRLWGGFSGHPMFLDIYVKYGYYVKHEVPDDATPSVHERRTASAWRL